MNMSNDTKTIAFMNFKSPWADLKIGEIVLIDKSMTEQRLSSYIQVARGPIGVENCSKLKVSNRLSIANQSGKIIDSSRYLEWHERCQAVTKDQPIMYMGNWSLWMYFETIGTQKSYVIEVPERLTHELDSKWIRRATI